jgi:hypothetical protein
MHLGRYDQARIRAQVTLDYCRESDSLHQMASALLLSIRVALAEEAYGEADRLAQQVLAIHQKTGQQEGRAELAAVSAVIAYASGKREEMRQHVCEMLESAIREGRFQSLMLALPVTALYLAVRAQVERAVELYALASRYPYVANSRWFEDVAGREIDALTATLPQEVVAAARERGRARDLEATAAELLAELGG